MRNLAGLAERVLQTARTAGADDAEVTLQESTRFSTRVRQGSVETLTEATSRSLFLRLFLDHRVARASTSDLREETTLALVRGAVERARFTSQDPCTGLPDEFASLAPAESLALFDPRLPAMTADEKIGLARETERIGLSLDPRVRNSGGAGVHTNHGRVTLANTRGFQGEYASTGCSLGLHLLGQDDGNSQVSDYWYSAARRRGGLDSPEQVARTTVERVQRHFGARKIPTQEVPVVFEPVLAAELLSDLFGAVTGETVYLRRSFLSEAMGQKVASEYATIVDDALRPGGLGTRPFDGEGVASQRTVVIEKGVLKNFLCGTYSARKLGRRSTGSGTSNGETPGNFYLEAGTLSPAEILAALKKGLYLTRLIGQGVNLVTGDYSRGAFGLWIEGGRIAFPVHEVTVSGNLRRMLESVERVGNDLEFRDQFSAPTLQIAAMTVAGS